MSCYFTTLALLFDFQMLKNKIIIAIDGHSSTGKSSFAKAIANKLGYTYIDSGALYRAITLFALQTGVVTEENIDETELLNALKNVTISFSNSLSHAPSPLSSNVPVDFPLNSPLCTSSHAEPKVWLNGVNVSREIRSFSVSEMVSHVSALPFVRAYVDSLLQKWGEQKGIVMDGRDIGTDVFPQAELKIFMTATAEVRAQRRYKELLESGEHPEYMEIRNNIEKRDYLDQNRNHAPLRCAPDALVLDNSHLTPQEQMVWLEQVMAERWG